MFLTPPCCFDRNSTGKQVKVQPMLHHLVWFEKTGETLDDDEKNELQVSHLCGETRCMTMSHVHKEHQHINKSRICCHWVQTQSTATKERYWCPHTPQCVMQSATVNSSLSTSDTKKRKLDE